MSSELFNPQSGQVDPSDSDGSLDDMNGLGDAAGGAGQVDLVGSGASRKRISDATVVLVGTIVVGGAVLAGMRWLGSGVTSIHIDKGVQKTVDEWLIKASQPTDPAQTPATAVLSELTGDRTDAQVPLDQVKKNPFVLQVAEPAAKSAADVKLDPAELQRRQHVAQIRAQVERMRLSSIMGQGDKFVAVLDDQVVQVGDTIPGGVKVTSISAYDVTLSIPDDPEPVKKSLRN